METGSLVKFKRNTEPCIVYKVLNSTPVFEYDEVLERYEECIEIDSLGLVPKVLLAEAEEHEDNIPSIDMAVYITNNFLNN